MRKIVSFLSFLLLLAVASCGNKRHDAAYYEQKVDSIRKAEQLKELQRHTDRPFDLSFLVMNPGYRPENLKLIHDNAELLGIPITVFSNDKYCIHFSTNCQVLLGPHKSEPQLLWGKEEGTCGYGVFGECRKRNGTGFF